MEDFKILLQNWGLPELINRFEDEGITDDSFKLLDNEAINSLISKTGPKLIFKNKYWEYRSQIDINQSDSLGDSYGNSNYQQYEENTSFASGSGSISDTTSLFNEIEVISPSEEVIIIPAEPKFSVSDNTLTPPMKKIALANYSIFSDSLENILKKLPDGRLILMNRLHLTNEVRQKLAKIIINELLKLDDKYDIDTSALKKASEEIVKTFPNETEETYFIPYKSGKSRLRQPAKGKLWSRYVNVRAALRMANQHMTPKESVSQGVSDYSESLLDEENADLTFLKAGVEPYPRVYLAWENTFALRQKLYKNSTIEEIFNSFPCLKMDFSVELLESDFNHLYPDKVDIVYGRWPKVNVAILKEAKDRGIDLDGYSHLDSTSQALVILPLLFSPITLKKSSKSKTHWRPSRCEVAESFFLKVKDIVEVSSILERRKNKLQSYDLPIQPFGVLIDEKEFFLWSEYGQYKCNSSIRCLELLYKFIHALNLEYPSESKHVWQFIQELVFGMQATNKNSNTICLISDIKYQMNE